jgi:phosphatidylglycerophosphatase C
MKKIAFFDFDGTITTRDTMFELIRHQKGNRRFYLGFLANIPVFVALKLKLLSKQAAKERLLTYFFRNTEFAAFQSGCDTFVTAKLPSLIRPAALDDIKRLQREGFEIAVVSASAENWIKKWAYQMEVQLLGTKLEVVGGKLTGKLSGANCNGTEKENRIRAVYDLSQFEEIYCYGDSNGDKQMLALGTKAFYKPFR